MVIKQNTVNLQCDKGGGSRTAHRASKTRRKKEEKDRQLLLHFFLFILDERSTAAGLWFQPSMMICHHPRTFYLLSSCCFQVFASHFSHYYFSNRFHVWPPLSFCMGSASSVDVPTRQAYSVICNRNEPVICLLVHRSPAMLCWNFSAPFAIFHHVNPFWDIALLAVLSAENTPVPSPLKVCHGGHSQITWDCFMVCASNSTPFLFFFFFSSSTLIPIFFFLL